MIKKINHIRALVITVEIRNDISRGNCDAFCIHASHSSTCPGGQNNVYTLSNVEDIWITMAVELLTPKYCLAEIVIRLTLCSFSLSF